MIELLNCSQQWGWICGVWGLVTVGCCVCMCVNRGVFHDKRRLFAGDVFCVIFLFALKSNKGTSYIFLFLNLLCNLRDND